MSRAQPPIPNYDPVKSMTLAKIQLFLERYVQTTRNISAQLSGLQSALKKSNLTPERRTLAEQRVKVLGEVVGERKEIIKELERAFSSLRDETEEVKYVEYVELSIGDKVIRIEA